MAVIGILPSAANAALQAEQGRPTTRATLYACFEGGIAHRLDQELGSLQPGQALPHWVIDEFRAGTCLALPKGAKIEKSLTVRSGRIRLSKVLLEGSSTWLYSPNWLVTEALTPGHSRVASADRRLQALQPMQEKTRSLMAEAEVFFTCRRDIEDFNERARQHNRSIHEAQETGGYSRSTPSVVFLGADSEAVREGRRLKEEGRQLEARCGEHLKMQAHPDFLTYASEVYAIQFVPGPFEGITAIG
jgi:hypothetical protein